MTSAKAMRTFITRKHAGRKRQDGTPDSVHLKRVTALLLTALKESGEMPRNKKLATLVHAALGHDLLEDTSASPVEVAKVAGPDALTLIRYLTNTKGDSHTRHYVRQIQTAPEEARLVKLADLCDNTLQASVSIQTLGTVWMKTYFLPIIDPMRNAIVKTRFSKYPKTAALLSNTAVLARAHLEESMLNLNRKGTWIG